MAGTSPPAGKTALAGLDLDLDLMVETEPPNGLDRSGLERLIRFVLDAEGSRGSWAVAVVLTDDERLQLLHRDYMGIDTPTDVMTFPFVDEDAPPTADRGGDVVVSVERATAQAAEFGQTPADEVRFLVVHGLLHLCGWDDASDAARDRMLERQATLIAAFDAAPRRPRESASSNGGRDVPSGAGGRRVGPDSRRRRFVPRRRGHAVKPRGT